MVFALSLSEREIAELFEHSYPTTTKTISKYKTPPTKGGELCILVVSDSIVGVGAAYPGQIVTRNDRRIHVQALWAFPDEQPAIGLAPVVPSGALVEALESGGGRLPRINDELATARLREVLGADPINHVLAHLKDRADSVEARTMTADAELLAVRASGLDPRDPKVQTTTLAARDAFRRFRPQPHEQTFVADDMSQIAGYDILLGGDPDCRVLSNGRRTVTVCNVDSTKIEAATGVDLIYFNSTFQALTAVQYKMLEGHPPKTRIDSRAVRQLGRMLEWQERLDALDPASSGSNFRLGPHGSMYFKFVNWNAEPDPLQLHKGIYLPAALLKALIDEGQLRDSRGTTPVVSYSTVPRHLNSTAFITLMTDAWTGTRGASFEEAIQMALDLRDAGQALVLAVSSDADVEAMHSA